MVTPTVTTKVNNSNYDVSADQWNALIAATNASIAATKNQPYSYIIYKSGSTYYARNGATGAVDYSETTLADALTEAFTALTADGGVIFLSQLAFPMTSFASIPEGVRVVCDYNAEHWEYINSADSSGSPYTVSVGSGVNNGYYLGQDSEGRILYASSDIKTIINSCIDNYSHIKIMPGDYGVLSGSIAITSKHDVVLEAKNARFELSTNSYIVSVSGESSNVVVDGLILTGSGNATYNSNSGIVVIGAATGCTNIEVKNCQVYSCGYDGILFLRNVTGGSIHHNYVSASGDDGINVGGVHGDPVSEVVVSENIVENCVHDGIHVSDDSEKIVVNKNRVSGCNNGVGLYRTTESVISENIISNIANYGIVTLASGTNNNIIRNNILKQITEIGINLPPSYGEDYLVEGNDISDFPDAGIRYGIQVGSYASAVSNARILNNYVSGAVRGMYLNVENSVVSKNHVKSCSEYGIAFSSSSSAATKNTEFSENVIDTTSSLFYIRGSGLSFTNNILLNGTYALNFYANTLTDIKIKGNIMRNIATSTFYHLPKTAQVHSNIGYVTEASGNSTGVGSEQAIAHGCDFTPTYNQVILSERSTGGALAYQSSAPDATNIYVTATNTKDFTWQVKYNP